MPPLSRQLLIRYYADVDPRFDPPPLQGLQQVDWAQVHHAHGPATDLPALLRALISEEPDHRDFACQLLFETIWHQGDVYEATVAAVPFLFNLLEASGPHDKGRIAHLLASIADGRMPLARCEDNPQEAELWRGLLSKEGRSLASELAHQRKYYNELMRCVSERLDVLYPYLRDPEPEFRLAVAVALGKFPDRVERIAADLEQALQHEPDKWVRAALEDTLSRRSSHVG